MRRYMLGTILAFATWMVDTTVNAGCQSWYDAAWDETIELCEESGTIRDSSGSIEQLERWTQGDTLTQGKAYGMRNRIGNPDNLFVIQPNGQLGLWTGCEFGPCVKKRVLRD